MDVTLRSGSSVEAAQGQEDHSADRGQRHASKPLDEPYIAKFHTKYIPEPNSGCWIWLDFLSGSLGYGYFYLNGSHSARVRIRAHRFSYELHKGLIPHGMVIDHLCRNPCCVNPDHLEAVTHRENVIRGQTTNRKERCKYGHLLSGDNLYTSPKGARQCLTCKKINAKRYWKTYRRI